MELKQMLRCDFRRHLGPRGEVQTDDPVKQNALSPAGSWYPSSSSSYELNTNALKTAKTVLSVRPGITESINVTSRNSGLLARARLVAKFCDVLIFFLFFLTF